MSHSASTSNARTKPAKGVAAPLKAPAKASGLRKKDMSPEEIKNLFKRLQGHEWNFPKRA